jgi:processive 1,2-diacylglycerol beta-glucosyltransferase
VKKNILILSASMGTGHTRAAQALEEAFRRLHFGGSLRHEDALNYTNAPFRQLYSRTYIDLVNKAPELLGWLYDYSDQPWKTENHRLAFEMLNASPLIQLLARTNPDLVISTHFLPADLISWLICKNRIRTNHSIVITDFDVHAMWLCHHYSNYFVALEETQEHLAALGFDREKIEPLGIPAHPLFAQSKDKRTMRRKHGLKPELTTILVSTGGFGVGPMEQILQSLMQIRIPSQLAIVCGRNEELRKKLSDFVRQNGSPLISTKMFGFTSEMDELMSASDLIVGKPGGLTAAEALTKGLVFVIVNPIPGQEERNSDHLIEEGAAIRCNNLPALPYKIERLLKDPWRLSYMRQKARDMSRPDAALAIAQRSMDLLENEGVCLSQCPQNHKCLTVTERAVEATRQAAKRVVNHLGNLTEQI